ncbi:MAG TPA: DoxX family protein [Chitinophagaceae bacterium]|nr:DoxX family protein [Chitinophagaceae bacterium]
MKVMVTIVRIIVGVLFIFSGLVKANDPLGLSYKMQEFFEVWGLHGFNSWTLLMSVLMNAFEIIAGFALLLGWRIRLFSWLLLLLIVFFTFLTGYTYITGMPKNCGCFGDCLPITSQTSFLKDVALTLLIGFLIWKQRYINLLFSEKPATIVMLGITILSFGFQWYTLTYLPVVDCLPFKKGNNITEQMKMPANAVPDSTVITFVYKKEGKEVEFTADKFPADFSATTYEFVNRYDKVIRKGKNNEPPIKGFALSGESNTDSTRFVLEQESAILLFCEKFSDAGTDWKKKFEEIYTAARAKNIASFIITAEPGKAKDALAGTRFADVPVFKCDFKVIETAARSNPCIYFIKKGTVISKYSGKEMNNIKKNISVATAQVRWPLTPAEQSADSTIQQP